MDFGADRSRGCPEANQIDQGGVDRHEILPPGGAVGLDHGPEVSLGALWPVNHGRGRVAKLVRLSDRDLDEIVDGEEDAAVATALDDRDCIARGGAVAKQSCADATLDERVDIDDADVEGVVLRVADRVSETADVGANDLQLCDYCAEVARCLDQPGTPDTEVRAARQLDQPFDADVSEHQLSHTLCESFCCGYGQRQTDVASGLVVDPSQGILLCSWYGTWVSHANIYTIVYCKEFCKHPWNS